MYSVGSSQYQINSFRFLSKHSITVWKSTKKNLAIKALNWSVLRAFQGSVPHISDQKGKHLWADGNFS